MALAFCSPALAGVNISSTFYVPVIDGIKWSPEMPGKSMDIDAEIEKHQYSFEIPGKAMEAILAEAGIAQKPGKLRKIVIGKMELFALDEDTYMMITGSIYSTIGLFSEDVRTHKVSICTEKEGDVLGCEDAAKTVNINTLAITARNVPGTGPVTLRKADIEGFSVFHDTASQYKKLARMFDICIGAENISGYETGVCVQILGNPTLMSRHTQVHVDFRDQDNVSRRLTWEHPAPISNCQIAASGKDFICAGESVLAQSLEDGTASLLAFLQAKNTSAENSVSFMTVGFIPSVAAMDQRKNTLVNAQANTYGLQ